MPHYSFADSFFRVKGLLSVLQDADDVSDRCELSERQKTGLEHIAGGCHNVLLDLQRFLDRYGSLQDRSPGFGNKVKRVWSRLEFEPDDILQLRERLILHISLLETCLGDISRFSSSLLLIDCQR